MAKTLAGKAPKRAVTIELLAMITKQTANCQTDNRERKEAKMWIRTKSKTVAMSQSALEIICLFKIKTMTRHSQRVAWPATEINQRHRTSKKSTRRKLMKIVRKISI